MPNDKGFFAWLVRHPGLVLVVGVMAALIFLGMSVFTYKWHWFPRGGAVMGLCGFLVSVREALLYRPARAPEFREIPKLGTGFEGLVRTSAFGTPVLNPDAFMTIPDPDAQEEHDKDLEERRRAWEDAHPIGEGDDYVLVKAGDEGRPLRDLSEMAPEELSRLRTAAILGVLGTLIWAFGDLLGGLPPAG